MPSPHTNADGAPLRPESSEAAPLQDETKGERLWIIVGDLHGDAALLTDVLETIPELPHAEGVILTGDISRAGGGVPSARSVIEAAEALCPVVLAQIGNIDQPQVDTWLDEQNLPVRCEVSYDGAKCLSADISDFALYP